MPAQAVTAVVEALATGGTPAKKRVLVPIADGTEEIEAVTGRAWRILLAPSSNAL
jgi:hypothetical protein